MKLTQNESFQKRGQPTLQSKFGLFHGPQEKGPEQKEQTQNIPSKSRKEKSKPLSVISRINYPHLVAKDLEDNLKDVQSAL